MTKKIFLLLPVLLFACKEVKHERSNTKPYEIIDIDNCEYSDKPLHMSEFADSISYVVLESRKDMMIGSGGNFRFTNQSVFIQVGGTLCEFGNDGKAIGVTVKQGKGPNEGYVRCFDIDEQSNKLFFINNFTHAVHISDLKTPNFTKIADPKEGSEPNHFPYTITYYKNNLLFTENINSTKYFLYVYNLDSKKIIYQIPDLYNTNINVYKVHGEDASTYINKVDDMLYYKEMFCDTVYKTSDMKVHTPVFVFKYKDKVTHTIYMRYNRGEVPIRDLKVLGDFAFSARYVFFSVWYKNSGHIGIYDRKSQKTKLCKSDSLVNDLDGGPNVRLGLNCASDEIYKEHLYFLVEPGNIIDGEPTEIKKSAAVNKLLSSITEGSNSVLVKVSLKE